MPELSILVHVPAVRYRSDCNCFLIFHIMFLYSHFTLFSQIKWSI